MNQDRSLYETPFGCGTFFDRALVVQHLRGTSLKSAVMAGCQSEVKVGTLTQ